MAVQTLPRTALRLGVQAARLPLTAAEAMFGHHDDASWAPALAFDAVQGQVKETAGVLLRDEVLVEEGKVISAKVTKLRQAADLDELAAERRTEADDDLADARRRAAQQRKTAKATAARRKQQARKAEHAAKQKAEKVAATKEARADQATKAAADVVDREARRERTAALAKEQAAIDKERAAVSRTKRAATADKAIATSKRRRAARKTSA